MRNKLWSGSLSGSIAGIPPGPALVLGKTFILGGSYAPAYKKQQESSDLILPSCNGMSIAEIVACAS